MLRTEDCHFFSSLLLVTPSRHFLSSLLSIERDMQTGIVIDPHPPDMAALLQLAQETGLAAYDAAYIKLAQRRGLPLATRDPRQARAACAIGVALA